jgi:peptidoglycan/LPS O-acetylase OafA/YrhL
MVSTSPAPSVTQKPVGARGYIPELDGLRGLAILMVVLCHYVFASNIARTPIASIHALAFGFFATGVDLFFVLSGFLIGGILLDNRSSGTYFKAFYGRRIWRIFPVYYGFLLLILAQSYLLRASGKRSPAFDAGTPFWLFWVFLQNFGMAWFGGTGGWISISMTWSLAIEEQFYLVVPTLVRLLKRRWLVVCASLIVLSSPVIHFAVPAETGRTVGSLALAASRFDGMAAGLLCAIFVRSRMFISVRKMAIASGLLAALVLASLNPYSPIVFMNHLLLTALYSCVLLIAVEKRSGTFGALLRSKPLCFFGKISFALYMVHQAVLLMFHSVLLHSVPEFQSSSSVAVTLGALLASVLICKISWEILEKPLVSWARIRYRY